MDIKSNKKNHSRVMKIQSEEIETSNVIGGKFGMCNKPIDVQITIHINNLFITYDKKRIVPIFKDFLHNPETINDLPGNVTIKDLINYYSIDIMKNWFSVVYGWKFNQKVG